MYAIGYARLSEKDNSSNSIKSQSKAIEEYCAYHKLTLLKIFVDDGRSGWTFDRPGFKELEAFCRANRQVQYMVIKHFDRFSRADPVDAMVMDRMFRDKLGIKVVQVTEQPDVDVTTDMYVMMRFMQAFASNQERNRIVDRTITGLRYLQLQGRWVTMAPFGYKNARDGDGKPTLLIDEERKPIVAFMFNEYLRGASLEEIKQSAGKRGFTNRGNNAVMRLLQNPVYAGLVSMKAYKGTPAKIIKGLQEPIISEHTYWLVQDKLVGKNYRHHNDDAVPLRGYLKCGICGKHFTAAPTKNRHGAIYWYYFCSPRHAGANYNANKLHKQLLEILECLSIDAAEAEHLEAEFKEAISWHISNRTRELMRVELQISKLQQVIQSIEERYLLTPDMSVQAYRNAMDDKQAQLNTLMAQRAGYKSDAAEMYDKLGVVMKGLQNLRLTYDAYDTVGKQTLLKGVFGCEMVYTDGTYLTPYIDLTVSYNELILKQKGLVITNQPDTLNPIKGKRGG